MAAGDEASLRKAVELEPGFKPAALPLARRLLDAGRAEEALAVLEPVEDDEETLALAEEARSGALPADERSRIEGRLGELLDRVKDDDEARQEYVGLLDELTVGSPTDAAEWRKKLSARLF